MKQCAPWGEAKPYTLVLRVNGSHLIKNYLITFLALISGAWLFFSLLLSFSILFLLLSFSFSLSLGRTTQLRCKPFRPLSSLRIASRIPFPRSQNPSLVRYMTSFTFSNFPTVFPSLVFQVTAQFFKLVSYFFSSVMLVKDSYYFVIIIIITTQGQKKNTSSQQTLRILLFLKVHLLNFWEILFFRGNLHSCIFIVLATRFVCSSFEKKTVNLSFYVC